MSLLLQLSPNAKTSSKSSGGFDDFDPFDPFASPPGGGGEAELVSPTAKMADIPSPEKSSYDDEFADLLGDFSGGPPTTNGIMENGDSHLTSTTVVKETITTTDDGEVITTVTETRTEMGEGDVVNGDPSLMQSGDLMGAEPISQEEELKEGEPDMISHQEPAYIDEEPLTQEEVTDTDPFNQGKDSAPVSTNTCITPGTQHMAQPDGHGSCTTNVRPVSNTHTLLQLPCISASPCN